MGLGKLKTPQSLLFLTKNQWRGWGWGGCWNKHCLGCCKPLRVPETLVLTVCAFLFFAPGGGVESGVPYSTIFANFTLLKFLLECS